MAKTTSTRRSKKAAPAVPAEVDGFFWWVVIAKATKRPLKRIYARWWFDARKEAEMRVNLPRDQFDVRKAQGQC